MDILLIVIGYLVGAIPFALLLTRQRGMDLRRIGSGNVGAANALRASGASLGVTVLLLDISKGAAVVLFAERMGATEPVVAAVAGAAVLGHIYPVWVRFRGGKGVATACGVFLVLAPLATLTAAATFVGVVWATRYVSLGSIVATVVLVAAVHIGDAPPGVSLAASGVAVLVLYRHRANMARLQAGRERRLNQGV